MTLDKVRMMHEIPNSKLVFTAGTSWLGWSWCPGNFECSTILVGLKLSNQIYSINVIYIS